MDYGYLTLVAPILTLAVAIATRKVPLAMLVGIFTGQLIICGWNPFAAINESVNGILSVCADTGNLKTFLFTALMGAFVILVRISGGVKGFVNYLTEQSKRVKSPRMAMLIAYVIGIIIFIDGLLSIMFTGVVTRPLIDKFKVSREKLAYICDATSAPVNAIIPLNSWGAMLMGLISAEIASGYIQGEPMNLLIRSLPFQFYSILSLLFVLFYIVTGKDWGPMKKAELRVRNTGKLYDDGVTPLLNDNDGFEELVEEGKENKWNMMFPLITLIGGAFIGLLVTGGGNLAAGDGTTAILYSVVITLLIMCVMYTKQGIMTAKEFGDSVMKGVSSMMGLVILLVLSFSIGGVIKGMGTGQFLASLLGDSIDGAFCPAIIFLMGALMAFCTGTSWGTFSIMMPIAVPMAVAMNGNILLTIGAVVSGGIFGKLSAEDAAKITGAALPIAKKDEVKTGKATILATVSGNETREYDIEIEKIYSPSGSTRNLLLRVTDEELLAQTGGVVQGMSGSAILQDGKIIGAVTHVLLDDPSRGYGIFIENMLSAAGLSSE